MQAAFGSRFNEFRKEKMTLSFPVTPLEIDPSLLNTFPGVNQADLEMEMADIADKDLWVSKFKSLTAELEDVTHQKAYAAANGAKLKASQHLRNLCLKHGMLFLTVIGT